MTRGMFDELNVKLAFPGSTHTPEGLGRVLAALEHEPLVAPTHAGTDERKPTPYRRQPAVALMAANAAALQLWRTKAPKYAGAVTVRDTSHNVVHADYDRGLKDGHLPALFAAATRIAADLRPEFGFVHMLWRLGAASQTYNSGARIGLAALCANGLAPVHARTWFGPDMVAAIGARRLLALPRATRTSWGGIQLDLTDRPWEADFETLRRRQREVLAALEPYGIVGNYAGPPVRWKPGAEWKPPDWDLGARP